MCYEPNKTLLHMITWGFGNSVAKSWVLNENLKPVRTTVHIRLVSTLLVCNMYG